MTKSELTRLLEEIGEMFPRLNTSEIAIQFWYKHIGRYSSQQIRQAFDRHIALSSNAPTIADIKGALASLFGGAGETKSAKLTIPYCKLDFCMDMLTPKFVSEELRMLAKEHVGEKNEIATCLALCKCPDFSALYQSKLKELYDLACIWWNEGKRPSAKWLGHATHEEMWPHADVPEFDDGNQFFTRRIG